MVYIIQKYVPRTIILFLVFSYKYQYRIQLPILADLTITRQGTEEFESQEIQGELK